MGGLLISLLRHADRVTCACLAQLVNVISPIRAEAGGPAWRQTTFYPFSLTARHASGTVVPLALEVPMVDTAEHGPVPAVDGVATYDAASDAVSVFLVNRDAAEPVTLELALDGLGRMQIVEHVVLADDDPYARNTTDAPTRVEPRRVSPAAAIDGLHPVTLPPVSWSLLRLEPAAATEQRVDEVGSTGPSPIAPTRPSCGWPRHRSRAAWPTRRGSTAAPRPRPTPALRDRPASESPLYAPRMPAATQINRPARLVGVGVVLIIALVAGAVVGGILDYRAWHATAAFEAVIPVLLAVVIAIGAGAWWLMRRRWSAGLVAVAAVVFVVGFRIGAWVAPSANPPDWSSGTITLDLHDPPLGHASGAASCTTQSDGSFSVGSDPAHVLAGTPVYYYLSGPGPTVHDREYFELIAESEGGAGARWDTNVEGNTTFDIRIDGQPAAGRAELVDIPAGWMRRPRAPLPARKRSHQRHPYLDLRVSPGRAHADRGQLVPVGRR